MKVSLKLLVYARSLYLVCPDMDDSWNFIDGACGFDFLTAFDTLHIALGPPAIAFIIGFENYGYSDHF